MLLILVRRSRPAKQELKILLRELRHRRSVRVDGTVEDELLLVLHAWADMNT